LYCSVVVWWCYCTFALCSCAFLLLALRVLQFAATYENAYIS
jgi:hypothetical protein